MFHWDVPHSGTRKVVNMGTPRAHSLLVVLFPPPHQPGLFSRARPVTEQQPRSARSSPNPRAQVDSAGPRPALSAGPTPPRPPGRSRPRHRSRPGEDTKPPPSRAAAAREERTLDSPVEETWGR